MTKNSLINKNTFYMLSIDLKMIISAYGSKTSKYKLNKQDLKNNWYISIKYLNIVFNIPFKCIFHTNTKIKGIKGLDFNNATYCTSYRLGFCQIPCKNYCYAYVFEKQYIKSTSNNNGFLKFNSYYKGFLLTRFFKALYNDKNLYYAFIDYIDKNIKILRFNVNSEFNNINDFNLILDIAVLTNVTIYGYTARNDLLKDYNDLKKHSTNFNNLFINGSNTCYDNRYMATFSLKEYYYALNKCLGSCNKCKKCFKLKKSLIVTLFHNSNSDSILNTYDNRAFIVYVMNAFNIDITVNDLKVNKGIFSSLNKTLISKYDIDLKALDIKNIKGFLDSLDSLYYDIKDNIELYNEDKLRALKLI